MTAKAAEHEHPVKDAKLPSHKDFRAYFLEAATTSRKEGKLTNEAFIVLWSASSNTKQMTAIEELVNHEIDHEHALAGMSAAPANKVDWPVEITKSFPLILAYLDAQKLEAK